MSFHADCDGAETGVDLNRDICNDLVTFGIPDVASRGVIRYGDRSIGRYDVNLPQRYISGTCAAARKTHTPPWSPKG